MGYIPVLPVDEIPAGERAVVEIDSDEILVLHVGADFYAISNVCSHERQSLEEGYLDGCTLSCPKHGAKFDIRDGAVLSLPASRGIKSYPIRVQDGVLEILI